MADWATGQVTAVQALLYSVIFVLVIVAGDISLGEMLRRRAAKKRL